MADENIIDDSGVPKLKLAHLSESLLTAPQLTHAPLGELLLAARNAKKLTQKDVSNSLRISIKQITALETDDFALLPDAMITRGFIRNYARLLEVDAEPLLASYRAQMPDKAPAKLSVHSSMNTVMSGKDSQPWLIYILSSILVLLFLLAWLFYVDYMPKPVAETQPQSVALPTASSAEIALPEVALPAAERQADATVSEVLANSKTPTTNIVEENRATSNIANPVVSPLNTVESNSLTQRLPLSTEKRLTLTSQVGQLASSSAVDFNTLKANAAQAPVSTQASENKSTEVKNSEIKTTVKLKSSLTTKKLTVSVDEQTWISVSDQSGIVIYEKLLEAGSTDGFDGEPPFNVLVGNAKATKLMFLGKQLDLTEHTKNNVARLVLQ